MNETFMKEKPVLPLLLSMALPNVISMLVNSLYNIVDSLFVARISEDAMTALSLVFPIQNFSNAIAIGFGIGINAMIALYLGAGDREKAETAATHGFVLSLVHGVVMMVVSIAIMPGFLSRFTQDEALIAAGITYSTIVFLFLVVNMVSLAFEKIFQAVGRMKVSMVALITGCVCNILLDPVLIFGLGPVPAMGIAGAALATGIGQALSVAVYLVVYLRTELPVRLRRRCLRPDAALDGRLYAIGIPAILNLALPSLLVTFLNGLLAAFSQSYVVVLGIYYKLQTFLYLPANGFVPIWAPARSRSRTPRPSQGTYSTCTPACSSCFRGRRTALCSMGEVTTRSPGRSSPLSSRFSPWVAPEVNATLRGPGPFTRVQSRSRTSSTPPAAS